MFTWKTLGELYHGFWPVILRRHVPGFGVPLRPQKTRPTAKQSAAIAQLGDDAYETREAAEKRLAAIGKPALEPLRGVINTSTDAEVRERARRVIAEITYQGFRALLKEKHWGELEDPDRDCTYRVEEGRIHIKIPGTAHVLTAEIGMMNAPRVLRNIEGDFELEVKVAGDIPSDARTLLNGAIRFTAPA